MNNDATDPEGKRRLEQSAERLKDFIAQAQHDLRNPLGNILGFCEILLKQAQAPGEEFIKTGLSGIDQVATRMVKDLDQVLDPDRTPAAPEEVKALQGRLQQQAVLILRTTQL